MTSSEQEIPSAVAPASSGLSTHARHGVALGLFSAVAYSAANLALRGLSGRHADLAFAIWVTAMKALPTVVLACALLIRRKTGGQPLYPSRRVIPALIFAGVIMQFGGNLGFQLALGHIGLAISVPLVFAFIICAGVVLGRTFLGDGVTQRTVVSICVMALSIVLLSYAATLTDSPETEVSTAAPRIVWLGVLMAVISGTSYGINGVVIRRVARQTLPVESMLLIYSSTGVICLSLLGANMMGRDRLLAIRADEWQMMLWAGTFNAIAFFCITHSLKRLNITQVNVINATQNAMCAVGAVMLFSEPASLPMVSGVLLSMVGLFILDRK